MKKTIFTIVAALALVSCNTESTEKASVITIDSIPAVVTPTVTLDSCAVDTCNK